MINNLLKTWNTLAQSEADHLWGFDLETRNRIGSDADFSAWLEQPINKAICQGYIQRCICNRGWLLTFDQIKYYLRIKLQQMMGGKVYQCSSRPDECHEAMLTAYMRVLAAQRAIAPNTTWQHFKGGDCTVIGCACYESVSGLNSDAWLSNDSSQRQYRLEENPDITLWLNYYKGGELNYSLVAASEIADHDDRVFYLHDGIGYAQKVDDFLGVVGPEHEEHEGLLRFMEME